MSITDKPRPRSFRIVADAIQIPLVVELLEEEGFRLEPLPVSRFCFRLLHEPLPLGSSIAARFGYIYIQDRSSMLPPLALNPPRGAAILDMAASPGGKAGFLCQLTGPEGFVLANEPDATRLATLRANLRMLNLVQTATSSYPGESLPLPENIWNCILLDPPCSGWGTALKHPRAPKIWRGKRILPLIHLQRLLLARAASLLAPGGRLLYSTCTTNADENQAQTRYAIAELGLEPLPLPEFSGFQVDVDAAGGMVVNEAASGAQGFYLSLLKKPDQGAAAQASPGWRPEHPIEPQLLASPLFDADKLPPGVAGLYNDKIWFFPRAGATLIPSGFRQRGSLLGKYRACRFHPDPRLRSTLPADAPRITLDGVGEVRRLLAGASLRADTRAPAAALCLNGLPLLICPIKNGRVILNGI